MSQTEGIERQSAQAVASLPAWIYHDPDFFALERERLFMPSWQLVCHLNDIPRPGDYHTLDFLGELVVTVRGRDGVARTFHNVCRHRAARLVDGPKGNCGSRLVCPYHAWTYDLDGRLVGLPGRRAFGDLDLAQHGLVPLESEVWRGFVFARVESSDGPSVAAMMAPYDEELAPYRLEEMQPLGRVTPRPRPVNWKNVADNYADSLHITIAHPGLTRLFGRSYGIEAKGWVHKMWGDLQEEPARNSSERAYQKILPRVPHLPEAKQRHWCYYKLWPNTAFDLYPDQMDFMQFIPVSATETLIREIPYALPDQRREMKLARYLNWRINRLVNREDTALIGRVQQGMGSRSYTVGPLGESEVCLRDFTAKMHEFLPLSRHPVKPPTAIVRAALEP